MKADITENLKFLGRLSIYKNWNDDTLPTYPIANWLNRTRLRTDEDLNVERAYVDYFFSLHEKLPMALTFGRLPFADGMPTELRDDTILQS